MGSCDGVNLWRKSSFSLCSNLTFPAHPYHFITVNLACWRKESEQSRHARVARARVRNQNVQQKQPWESGPAYTHRRCSGLNTEPCGDPARPPLLREVTRKNRETEGRGRPRSASELYLWRHLKPPCRTDPLLTPVEQYRVILGRGKGLCQTLAWGDGPIEVLHYPADPSTCSLQAKETLLEMLVFNQSILLNQKPQIHSFLCSALAQDQWRPQNPTVQFKFSCSSAGGGMHQRGRISDWCLVQV